MRLTALLAAWSVVGTVGSAAAATTVGETGTPFGIINPYEFVTGSYAVPAGAGDVITSFHTQSAASCLPGVQGVYDFQVLRPLGDAQYLVLGDTGNQTDPCDGQLHSYPVNIPVQAGDVLGVYVVSTWQGVFGLPQASSYGSMSEPAVGDTVTVPLTYDGYAIDESATLEWSIAGQFDALIAASTGVGPGTSLADTARRAQAYYQAGDTADTCATLTAYVNEVGAQRGKKIPASTADELISAAQQLSTAVGC